MGINFKWKQFIRNEIRQQEDVDVAQWNAITKAQDFSATGWAYSVMWGPTSGIKRIPEGRMGTKLGLRVESDDDDACSILRVHKILIQRNLRWGRYAARIAGTLISKLLLYSLIEVTRSIVDQNLWYLEAVKRDLKGKYPVWEAGRKDTDRNFWRELIRMNSTAETIESKQYPKVDSKSSEKLFSSSNILVPLLDVATSILRLELQRANDSPHSRRSLVGGRARTSDDRTN